MTQREFFNIIINGSGSITDKKDDGTKDGTRTIDLLIDGAISPELKSYAEEAIAKLDNRVANRKTAPSQLKKIEERKEIISQVLDFMEDGATYTCGELAKQIDKSTQMLTPILKTMVENGQLNQIDGYQPAKGKSKCKGYTKA